MRALRGTAATLLVAIALAAPVTARADGGAFISFARTHYVPGNVAEGEGYIYVPVKHQDLIERGPFFSYLVNAGPAGEDLFLGTVEFERFAKTEFELRLSFTVPDVPGDYYTVRVCNDPCTVSGFKEPLTGTISIVETEREGALLTENTKLSYRNYALQRQVRKAERTAEELEAELAATEVSSAEATAAASEPSPAAAPVVRTVVEQDDRPLVDAWALLGIGGAFLVALACVGIAIAFSRGSRRHDPLPVK
jgi:hypothetical protein